MNDDEQKFDYGWLIDLALVCVFGAGFIAGFLWGLTK